MVRIFRSRNVRWAGQVTGTGEMKKGVRNVLASQKRSAAFS
jgi:hypothetical protein